MEWLRQGSENSPNTINRTTISWNVSWENKKQNNCQTNRYRSRTEDSLKVQQSKVNLENKQSALCVEIT